MIKEVMLLLKKNGGTYLLNKSMNNFLKIDSIN